MGTIYQNQFGRKPGRGWRPWLLIPKSLAVSLLLGGLVASAVYFRQIRLPETAEPTMRDVRRLAILRTIILCTVVPGSTAAVVLGSLLSLMHGRTFLRLRWWQIKTPLAILTMAAAHLWMASRLESLAEAWNHGQAAVHLQNQFAGGFVVIGILTILLIWLGRHKPNFPPPQKNPKKSP